MRSTLSVSMLVLAGCSTLAGGGTRAGAPGRGAPPPQVPPMTAFAAPAPASRLGPAALGSAGAPTSGASITAACASHTPEQKAAALASYARESSALTRDGEDVSHVAEAYARGLDRSPEVAMAQLTQYPVDVRLITLVENTYGAFMCVERERIDGPGPLERKVRAAKQALASFRGDLELRALKASAEMGERLGTAESLMKAYRAKESAVDEKRRPLLADSASDVREAVRGAEVVLRALEITRGKAHADTQRARRQLAMTNATLASLHDEIATRNAATTPVPSDVYTRADRAGIKAAVKQDWAVRFPGEQVLGVYVTGKQWTRKSGVYYRERDARVVQYDNSFLQVTVVSKTGAAEHADVWVYDVRRDHLEADNLKLDYAVTRARTGKVLASKVR